jgi:hypothetical protein
LHKFDIVREQNPNFTPSKSHRSKGDRDIAYNNIVIHGNFLKPAVFPGMIALVRIPILCLELAKKSDI